VIRAGCDDATGSNHALFPFHEERRDPLQKTDPVEGGLMSSTSVYERIVIEGPLRRPAPHTGTTEPTRIGARAARCAYGAPESR
jgi:hypothetical protein